MPTHPPTPAHIHPSENKMRVVTLLLCALSLDAVSVGDQTAAVHGLIGRIAPHIKDGFELRVWAASECSGATGKCFGYGMNGTKVELRGTSGVELSMAFNHYIKYVMKSSVSWWRTGGNQLVNLRSIVATDTVHIERYQQEHYYANVCTFSYSFVWYQLDDWVTEIDWMALNGVTLPLAYTGQEKVYQKVYNKLGVTNEQLSEYFGGPAFLAWSRGQGERGWGGPLPQSWIDGQWDLQLKILPLMRAFGMKPVLPGFQGNVPVAMMSLYPTANISRVGSCPNSVLAQYDCAPWLDALDPLFNSTADLFMKTVIADFGTDHYYAADGTFSHTQAPWYDTSAHRYDAVSDAVVDDNAIAHSVAAWNGLIRTDPDAMWVFQTWSWIYGATQPYMRGWVQGAPKGRLILLDLMAEEEPMWKKTESYYGTPYIWCMLHDFGGNDGMWGDMPALSTGPTTQGTTMIGTGLTMEGTNQNAVVYEFMNEMAYRSSPVDLEAWFADFATRRYGTKNDLTTKAWQILLTTAYNATGYNLMISKDTLTAIPFGTGWDVLAGHHWYNETYFLDAWSALLEAGKDDAIRNLEKEDVWTYRHDLADVTRQALAKFATVLWNRLDSAVKSNDTAKVKECGEAIVRLANDTNAMVATVPGFLLGTWVENAKKWGQGDKETTELMAWNAKTQVTFWGYNTPVTPNSSVFVVAENEDYANKQWSGLLDTYYGERWALYVKLELEAINSGVPLDKTKFQTELIAWYDTWRSSHDSFPTEPVGDTHEVSLSMWEKYASQIREN